jgi:hypothetical protein
MRRYNVKRSVVVVTLSFLGLLTLLTLFGLFYARPRVFFAALLAYAGWRWYGIVRTPVSLAVRDDGRVELRGLIGRRVLDAEAIRRIRRVGRGYVLEHAGGSIPLYGGIDRFNEFVLQVKAANPSLEVRGF